MSASLVGSEMCIRDRRRTALAFSASSGSEVTLSSRFVGRRGPVSGFEPVSYTHLTLPTICSV
eukprot:480578-Alexandrium_andersonii.AAC.1